MAATRKCLQIFIIDAFTRKPFAGNPAAVCLVKADNILDENKMQKIASEMNLSETAFITALNSDSCFLKGNEFGLRWFTPTNEVSLCGHATLASAAALFYCVGNEMPAIKFHTMSGLLLARRQDSDIILDFPQNSPVKEDGKDLLPLVKAIVGDLPVSDLQYASNIKKLLIRLDDKLSRSDLENLSPVQTELLSAHDGSKVKSVIVTLSSKGETDEDGDKYDFLSRLFAPWNGIPEDPVTGSAHTVSGPYWSKIFGKKSLYARQCSKRGGDIRMLIREDGRVDLSGQAVVVMNGSLHI